MPTIPGEPQAPLSPDRAFVVQLQAPDRERPEQLTGRVEHIASGAVSRFKSFDELRDFIGKAARSNS